MTSKGPFIKALLFLTFLLISIPANGTTYIVFRYDDFAADKPGIRETNTERLRIWDVEKKIDSLFEKYGFPYVIATIPKTKSNYGEHATNDETVLFDEDSEKVKFIRQAVLAGRVEVAQHGFSHINHAAANHKHSEFHKRNYKEQFRDILQGKEILARSLDLQKVTTFVPPFNSWDSNTAKALKDLDFKILSADRNYYYKSAIGLTIIPFTAQLWELESMLHQGNLPNDSIVVVLYHPPQIVDIKGKEHRFFGIERFERLLQKLTSMPSVKVVTLQQLAQECSSLTIKRYRAANALWRQRSFWAKLLPQHLWPGESDQCIYLPTEIYTRQVRLWRTLTVTLVTGLLLTGLAVRYLIRLALSAKWHWRIDVAASLLCCVGILSEVYLVYRGYHPTGIRAIPAIVTASFLIALTLRTIRRPSTTNTGS